MTQQEFFKGHEDSERIFHVVQQAIAKIGGADLKVTKSQIAFLRGRAFAWVWRPGQYLRGERPPLVLSLALDRRDPSPRWKEVVEPRPRRYMHHLELRSPGDVDAQVRRWLHEAAECAAAREAGRTDRKEARHVRHGRDGKRRPA